jgi:predicted metal-dependent peptidase
MDQDEYFEVLQELERYHALFSRFWSIGHIELDNKLNPPTACVTFDKFGDGLLFKIHPEFWKGLTLDERVFVIAHECLHVYLEHGRRIMSLRKTHPKLDVRAIANIAADVVVNPFLENAFGFSRKKIRNWERFCWLETVFPNDKTVLPHKSMEYYFNLIMKDAKKVEAYSKQGGGKSGGDGDGDVPQTLDEHTDMPEFGEEEMQEILDQISKEEMEDLEERLAGNGEEVAKAQQAGTTAGSATKRIKLLNIVKKRTWEQCVKDVLGRFKGMEKDIVVEQWAKQNRRMTMLGHTDMMLPAEIDEVMPVRERIDVWFFQDTSGSCVHLAERFFKAAASLPDDRFKVRLFCFDTQVYETDFKSGKLYGFGGTSFACIERGIQEVLHKEREKKTQYPSIVFVVTDGDGDNVSPAYPSRWHWFLSEGGNKRLIPEKSKIWELKNFE